MNYDTKTMANNYIKMLNKIEISESFDELAKLINQINRDLESLVEPYSNYIVKDKNIKNKLLEYINMIKDIINNINNKKKNLERKNPTKDLNEALINLISILYKYQMNLDRDDKELINEIRSAIINLLEIFRLDIDRNDLYNYIYNWINKEFCSELSEDNFNMLLEKLEEAKRKGENSIYIENPITNTKLFVFLKELVKSYDPELKNYEKIEELISRIIHGLEGFLKPPSEFKNFREFTIHNMLAGIWLNEIINLIRYNFINAVDNANAELYMSKYTSRGIRLGIEDSLNKNLVLNRNIYKKDTEKKLEYGIRLLNELYNTEGIEHVIPFLLKGFMELLKILEIYLERLPYNESLDQVIWNAYIYFGIKTPNSVSIRL